VAKKKQKPDLIKLARLRKAVSGQMGNACIALLEDSPSAVGFSNLENVSSIIARGPITPDHIIRTKRTGMIIGDEPEKSVERFAADYEKYFNKHKNGKLAQLDPAPRWAVWPGNGIVTFGKSLDEAKIVADISEHTIKAIQQAEKLGGWQSLSQKDLFEMEYWELEQAKLKKSVSTKTFQGKIALVTGAASGIGKACALALAKEGAVVVALDINPAIEKMQIPGVFGMTCDVTNKTTLNNSVENTIKQFGGLDLLISNAGIFSPAQSIENIDEKTWEQSLSLNLTSHQQLLQACIPYLEYGICPSVVIIGSKNVPAPDPALQVTRWRKRALHNWQEWRRSNLAKKAFV
jgi:hypothetical protein